MRKNLILDRYRLFRYSPGLWSNRRIWKMFEQLSILLILLSPFHSHAHSCGVRLLSAAPGATVSSAATTAFLIYLDRLIQIGVLTDQDIVHFRNGLESGIWLHPMDSSSDAADEGGLSLVQQIHYRTLNEYLQNVQLDRPKVLSKLDSLIGPSDRSHVQNTTLLFHLGDTPRIELGSFDYQDVKIHLTHPFRVQSRSVTRSSWERVMGGLPEDSRKVSKSDYGNDPVAGISLKSAMLFANRCSVLSGLKPVYLLEDEEAQIAWAAKGQAHFQTDERVRITASSIYETEGYRLPTRAEQLYLLSNLGRHWSAPFGISDIEIQDYAWIRTNSEYHPGGWASHPVATKHPFLIDSSPIYDLFGNVFSWNSDSEDWLKNGPIDPFALPTATSDMEIFGVSYWSMRKPSEWANPQRTKPFDIVEDRGLRLVRSLSK